MSYNPGDTVIVKSGGPALTVLSVDGDHVKCLFFSEELGEFKEAVIPAFALETYDDEEEDEDDASSEGEDEEGEDGDSEDDEDEDGEKAA
jgi:uncharacterized protein YodC (DUF2158 family)